MNHRRKKALATVLTSCSLALTACVSIPSTSDPNVIKTYNADANAASIPGPTDGEAPDQILRGFFAATAYPTRSHEAARQFLTPEASDGWTEQNTTMIVDDLDMSTTSASPTGTHAPGDPQSVDYQVRGKLVGLLGSGGTYTAQDYDYDITIRLTLVDGQWRISQLPADIAMDYSAFHAAYNEHTLYFPDQGGTVLVPDRRWVFTRQGNLGATLLNLLITGPRQEIQQGVTNAIPTDTVVHYDTDGDVQTISLRGLTQLDSSERKRVAAQVVWTLALADIRGPYRIAADGGNLLDRDGEDLSISDVAEYTPVPATTGDLFAVAGGNLLAVEDDSATPVPGGLGYAGTLTSVAVCKDVAAAVSVAGSRSTVLMGALDADPHAVVDGRTMTRPSFGADNTTAWVVVDGKRVVRMFRSPVNTEVSTVDASTSALESLLSTGDGKITEFRVARDGVRVAMIVDGRVYMAIISSGSDGSWSIVSPTPIAYALGDTAVSLGWQSDGSLLVGTSAQSAPLWRVEVDGSTAIEMETRNLQAPIVAVASVGDKQYVTDSRALFQREGDTMAEQYWREVPSLQGLRAFPAVRR